MVDYYRGSGYDKKFVNAIKSGATRDELNDMSVSDMRKALEQASYVVPLGMGANALRLAYKGYKAGKKAIGLATRGEEIVKGAGRARKSKLITGREQQAINREAALRAQRAADRANAAKTRASRAGKVAAGSGVVGLVANSISNSGTKTKSTKPNTNTNTTTTTKPTTNTNTTTTTKPTTNTKTITTIKKPTTNTKTTATIKKPKVAPSPNTNTRSGNIGRTTTKYDGKARVAPKPKDNTKKKYGKSGMGMAAYQKLTGSKR